MRMNILQKGILLVMAGCMLAVWPFCLVRRDAEQRSGDLNHAVTEELGKGSVMEQSFRAEESVLDGLDFVLTFDENKPRSGRLLFQLSNEDGKILLEQEIPYSQIPNYGYFTVPVNKWLHKNAVYRYSLKNVDIEDNLPKGVYTVTEEMHAAPNCGLSLNSAGLEGEALTRFHWKEPLNYKNVLSFWAFFGVVGFTLFEAAGSIKGTEKRDRQEKSAGSEKKEAGLHEVG